MKRLGYLSLALLLAGCGGAAESVNEAEVDAPAAEELEPVCALEGDYVVTYLPEPGCGEVNEFPARVELREVECETPTQRCEPGVPSVRCEFTRELGGECTAQVVWERAQ